MKCRVCKYDTGGYYWPKKIITPEEEELIKADLLDSKAILEWDGMPLYQRSYPGEPEYISPRCERCYNKAEKKKGREQ